MGKNSKGFEIFAPGNLILTRLIKVEYDPPQGLISEDYSIEFSVCRNVWGKFGHVNNLSTYLLEQVGGFGPEYGDEIYTYQIAGRNYTNYRKDVNLAITAGQLLGMAGQGGGYDFWLKDDRVELTWINQEWTREFQYTVCPLDYFNASLKSALQAKLKDWSGKPVYPPNYGGKIDFDVANTVQGIWTKEDFVNRAEDYGLALVYSNFNTSVGAISIGLAGNSSWDSRVYSFDPAEDGFENRVFNEVTSDGNVYYYFCNEFRSGMNYYKVILLKLTADRELRLQFIDNGGIPLPNDPRPLWNELNSIKYIR
jgi:hypothetical protein